MNDNRVLWILRHLSKPGARLSAPPSRSRDQSKIAALPGANRANASEPLASAEDIRFLLARDLIERSHEGFRISSAGVAWLRRRLSDGDFQAQHQKRSAKVIEIDGAKQSAIVNEADNPLAWLASRKDKKGAPLLAPYQLQAGERLHADYQFAGLTAKVTSSWNPAAAGNKSDGGQNDAAALQDHVLAARQRVVRALAAVGPELCGVLIDVCCHLKGLEEAEKTEGWPQRSGKVVLQIALTRLARHYGLITVEDTGARLKRKLMHWGAEDYRPKVGGGEAGS